MAQRRAVYLPENGIDPQGFGAPVRISPSQVRPLRILFVGRLVPYKGADIVLEAFVGSEPLRPRAELLVVGGPCLAALANAAWRSCP